MNYKRKTSKYYLHKEINLIMFKLYNLKQLFFILKKIQFVDGYKNIIKKLPKISNVILNSLLEKIVIELSGLVVDHNEDDLSIMSFIIKYHQYESDYKEKRYIYIYDINTNKKHRVYINTNSIKDDINELEQYIQNNEYIKKYGTKFGNCVAERKIIIGMNKKMVRDAWGVPDNINTTTGSYGTHEQWVYNSRYIYFKNGIVTSIQY